MTLFNILYMLCLGGVVLAFTNIGISYLSNHLHSDLRHNFRFNFKVNDDQSAAENDDEPWSGPRPAESISNTGNESLAAQPYGARRSGAAIDENVRGVIRGMKEHLDNPQELQSIGNALEETVSTILSNDMLRKAFVDDFRGISIDAIKGLLRSGASNQNSPTQPMDVEEES